MKIRSLLLAGALTMVAAPAFAQAQSSYAVVLPSQPLGSSLLQVSRLTGLQLAFTDGAVRNLRAPELNGTFTSEEILSRLLRGTGYTYRFTNQNTVRIFKAERVTMNELKPIRTASAAPVALTPGAEALALAAVQTPAGADASPAAENDIVVTGSRISRAELETAAPLIATLGSQELENRGFTNIADALNEIPGFGIPVTEAGGQSSFLLGQNFVNLFGIGSNRTLTLVNGRRFISSNSATNFSGTAAGLQVDLNVIPVTLIDRTDVLAVKGATTYGSDAIAGTVNLILKDDFEGLDVRAALGITERGDRPTYFGSATFGGNFLDGRANLVFSAEFDKREGLLLSERERTAANLFFTSPPPGTSTFSNILIRDRRWAFVTRNGVPSRTIGLPQFTGFRDAAGNLVQFDPSGNFQVYDPGSGTADVVNRSGGSGFNFAEVGQLTSDIQRVTAYALGHYEVTDNIRFFFESNYANVASRELANPAFFQGGIFPPPNESLGVLLSNPFLTQQARATLLLPGNLANAAGQQILNFDRNGDGVNDDTRFFLNRASQDLAGGTNEDRQWMDLYRLLGGLEGKLSLGGRSFNWNLSYSHGESKAVSRRNELVQANFINAVDAVSVSQEDINRLAGIAGTQNLSVIRNGATVTVPEGQLQIGDIACRVSVAPPTPPGGGAPGSAFQPASVTACVPLNLFGENRATPEALAFVGTLSNSVSMNKQDVFNANFGGELFQLFNNAVSFNLGYEHRRESQNFTPDAFLQEGLGRAVPVPPIKGAFRTNEFYGEVLLPLIQPHNATFIRALELDASARYIDNSAAGKDWVSSVGARMSPIKDITFRGSYTSSVRAPAITELFLQPIESFGTADDPCDARFINGGPNPALRAANCSAAGIKQPFTSGIVGTARRIKQRGNPNLLNERSKSWTAGIVLEPSFVPGLTLTADWVDIDLRDAVVDLRTIDVLRACYDSQQFPSAPACSQVIRAADGQVTDVITGFTNAGRFEFSGLQASARYGFRLGDVIGSGGDAGRINLSARYFYLDKLLTVVGSVPNNNRGEIGNFKHSFNATLGYELGNSSAALTARYLSGAIFDNDFTATTRNIRGVGDNLELDLSLAHNVGENITVRLTVNNLLDTDPPFPADNPAIYGSQLLGRRYQLTTMFRF